MSETKEERKKSKLSLSKPGTLELKKTVESGQVRQNFSHGRSKMVQVERRTKRTFALDSGGKMSEVKEKPNTLAEQALQETQLDQPQAEPETQPTIEDALARTLTSEEVAARNRARAEAKQFEQERQEQVERETVMRGKRQNTDLDLSLIHI